jgi:hypothetical protein
VCQPRNLSLFEIIRRLSGVRAVLNSSKFKIAKMFQQIDNNNTTNSGQMEQKICIWKLRLREPHFLKSSSSENFLQADWQSLAASSILHLTETISLASVQSQPTAAVWRPRVSIICCQDYRVSQILCQE